MLTIGKVSLCDLCFSEVGKKVKSCPYCNGKKNIERYPTSLKEGTVLAGRYCIGRILGKGGFGITYLAYDLKENKKVAIKEYMPDSLAHRNIGDTTVSTLGGEKTEQFNNGAKKFFNEAKLVSRFNGNPNIIGVYEFFDENNTTYFVMEYLSGIDMKDYLAKKGACSEGEMLYIIDKVTEALSVVHSINTLHRDISPDNIFICENGGIKLIDFGAARHVMADESNSLSVIIKHGFAPMEQYSSKGKQGPWTDIYALGASIYYGLTKRKADDAPSRYDDPTLDLSGISPEFARIIEKMMEVDIRDRYQNVLELRADLAALPITPVAPVIIPSQPLHPQSESHSQSITGSKTNSNSVQTSKSITASRSVTTSKSVTASKSVTIPKSKTVTEAGLNTSSQPQSKSKKWLIPVIAGAVCLTLILTLIPVFTLGSNNSDMDLEELPPTAEVGGDVASSEGENATQSQKQDLTLQDDSAQNDAVENSTPDNTQDAVESNGEVQDTASNNATNNNTSAAEKPSANSNSKPSTTTSKPSTTTSKKQSTTTSKKQSTTTSKPHTSHSFTTSKVTKEPTITSTGVRTYYCSGCSATKTETIPKLQGVDWKYSNGTLTVFGNGAIKDYAYLSGEYKSTAPWMEHQKSITKIVVESGITSIGNYAFYSCANVTSITISGTVTSIGKYAFGACKKVTSITIPSGVKSIGNYAFAYCDKLKTITIQNSKSNVSIDSKAFYGCGGSPTYTK